MEITKETIEAVLILLYKIDEHEACDEMMKVYRKYFAPDELPQQPTKPQTLRLVHKQHLH